MYQEQKDVLPSYQKDLRELQDARKYIEKQKINSQYYDQVTKIPNALKGKLEEDRQLTIVKVSGNTTINVDTCIKTRHQRAEITPIKNKAKLLMKYPNGKRIMTWLKYPLTTIINIRTMPVIPQLSIKAAENEDNWIIIETIEEDQPLNQELPHPGGETLKPVDKQFINPDRCNSFLRQQLSPEEIKTKIVFLNVDFGKPRFKERKAPLAIQITNYEGRSLFETKITPRKRIEDYLSGDHYLTEKQVINQMDEQEARQRLFEHINGKIIVGHRVIFTLQQCLVRPYKVAGIRDLAQAPALEKYHAKLSGKPIPIKEIHRFITAKKSTHGFLNIPRDRIQLIRNIYKNLEPDWKDHDEIHHSNSRKRTISNDNKGAPPKAMNWQDVSLEENSESIILTLQEPDKFLAESTGHTFTKQLSIDERIKAMGLEQKLQSPMKIVSPSASPERKRRGLVTLKPTIQFDQIPERIQTATTADNRRFILGKMVYYDERSGSPMTIHVEQPNRKQPYSSRQ